MEQNRQLELAEKIIEQTGCSLFLTGKAGTGKTTFLRNLRSRSRKRMVVCAPTGIAAINAGGMTLHSFFQLDFGLFLPGMKRQEKRQAAFSKDKIRMIRGLDLLVIDEVSMVRADMLDAVDDVLRKFRDRTLPFGGVQLLLIGDLQQLPPVVVDSERDLMRAHYRSPYFFESHALANLDYVTIELSKVYRQSDAGFLSLLNAVRDNRADQNVLNQLNQRFKPGFKPSDEEGYVRLTTHNHMADSVNQSRLAALPAEAHHFEARITGNFPANSYPADPDLVLKEGAQVMFIKNDTGLERQYFNGMMGKVTTIDEDGVVVTPDNGGQPIGVNPVEWENLKFEINEETKEITQKTDGVFSQLPLKLAWAITIHKSQGLTFDRAIIDASSAFTHGQTYVALSRCRTLEGMVLERPLTPQAIINDPTVQGFITSHTAELSTETVDSMVHAYRLHLAAEMFNFRPLFNALEGVSRLYNENFMRIYPKQVQEFTMKSTQMRESLCRVADNFKLQLHKLDAECPGEENPQLTQRIKDASRYFLGQLQELTEMTSEMPTDHDNKKVSTKLAERLELFESLATVRHTLLTAFCDEDFGVSRYLDIKAQGAFSGGAPKKKKRSEKPSEESADNRHPKLFDALRNWRLNLARERGVPAFTIAYTKTLLAISNHLPYDYHSLSLMPGVGPHMLREFGDTLLDIVQEYKETAKSLNPLPMPEPKQKKKRVKGDSARTSYDMFASGSSIEEIAQMRNVTTVTVANHLLSILDLGNRELVNRILTPERRHAIDSWLDLHDTEGMDAAAMRAAIGADTGVEPEYYELRLAQMLRESTD